MSLSGVGRCPELEGDPYRQWRAGLYKIARKLPFGLMPPLNSGCFHEAGFFTDASHFNKKTIVKSIF